MQREDPEQVGVIYGSGSGGLDLIFDNHDAYRERGYRRVAPTMIANMLPDSASGYIAIHLGAQGPNMAVTAACSTGGHNVGEEAAWVAVEMARLAQRYESAEG